MMVDKKRKVPNLRFKGFTNDWEQRKLGEVILDYKRKNNNDRLPVLTSSFQGIEYQEKHFGSQQKHDTSDYNVLPKEYMTYRNRSDNGYFRFNINNLGVTGIVSKFYPVFTTINTNKLFLASYINHNHRLKNHFKVVSVGTSQHVLSLRNFKKTNLLFPSKDEQDQIGKFFNLLNRAITLQQRKLELLKQLKKGFLQKMFPKNGAKVPELRFAGFADAWEERKLGEVAEKVYSGLSGKTKSDFGHGEAAYVTYINVHDNVIAKAKEIEKVEVDLKQNQVQKGDIFFTISSEVPEEVALNSVWPYETNTRLYLNSFCFGYRSNFKLVNPFFLSYYLRSPHLRQIIFPLAQGISRFNISKKSILQLPIKLPKLQEQKDIYRILQDLENLLSLQHQKLAKYQSVKKSLLQQMFI